MKNFVVCIIVLALGLYGPRHDPEFEAAWTLGLLILLAFLGQQLALTLRLPPIVGWVGAGLLIGPTGLQAIDPSRFTSLNLVYTLVALWVGCYVGTQITGQVPVPRSWLRMAGLTAASTTATFAIIFLGLAALTELPAWSAALLAAVASLWGPFAIWYADRRPDDSLLLAITGTACSLGIISLAILFLYNQGYLGSSSLQGVARIWLSLAAGVIGGELLWRFKLHTSPMHSLVPVFLVGTGLAATLALQLDLYGLLCGLSAGLVIWLRQETSDQLNRLLENGRHLAFPLFFALIGSMLNVRLLLWADSLFVQVLLVQIIVLTIIRGFGPTIWPLAVESVQARKIGWLLLPKGALLFELTFTTRFGLANVLPASTAHLISLIAIADILVFLLIFPGIAASMWRFTVPAEKEIDEITDLEKG